LIKLLNYSLYKYRI